MSTGEKRPLNKTQRRISLCWPTYPPLSSQFPFFLPYIIPRITFSLFDPSNPLSQSPVICFSIQISMASTNQSSNFEDHLPLMAEKLGGEGLMGELCKGFQLLKDGNKGVITFESLKKNAALLGLQDMTDEDLKNMVREGDFDGDGALNQMEFCVLMFRLSPELMEQAEILLDEAIQQQGFQFCF